MKTRNIILGLAVVAGMLTAQTESSAQLNKLLQKAKDNAHRIENAVNNQQKRQEAEQAAAQEAAYQADISSGKTYYVNASNGSNRNDGLRSEERRVGKECYS